MSNIQNNKLELLPHQEEAYVESEKLFAEKGKAAVIFPTGCGKSFVVLKYILEHPDERILFLSPRHAIKEQMYEYIVRFIGGDFRPIEDIKRENGSLKQAAKQYIPNIECMLYQTIMGIDEKGSIDELVTNLKPDIIIVDEMHHLKTKSTKTSREQVLDDSEKISDEFYDEEYETENEEILNQENKWGQKFQKLLELNPQAKLLGLSATPIRTDGANVVERIFNDAIASEISLLEAIETGIIYPPKYVVPDFIREDELKTLLEKIEASEGTEKEVLKAEYDELVKKSDQAKGIPELLRENITEQDGKYIIFCKDIKDMKEKMSKVQEWFGKIDNEPEIYGIHSKDSTSAKQLEAFNNSQSHHLKLMYCVGMIDEGVHLNNVSGVILAAKTGSRPTYLQRIGRTISSGKDKKQALVIDLVNNNEILTDEHNTQYGYEISDLEALEKLVDWIENKNDGKWPEYAEEKTIKEKAMTRRLARINNKYIKYIENPNLLEELNEEANDEIQKILQLGKTIGMFENIITIDLGNGTQKGIDVSINDFLHGIEIKGVRRDFREILNHYYFDISINMQNYEEYMEWCKKNGRLPRTNIQINGERIKVTKDGEKETEEQREIRLGSARKAFFTGIKKKDKLTEEEEKIKELYEELNKQYSSDILNYNEYEEWCKKNGRLPRTTIKINGTVVIMAKDGEEETKEQIEKKVAEKRKIFFEKIKRKKEREDVLLEEEEEIKELYEELDKQYSVDVLNYNEYEEWCKKNGRLPRTRITRNGVGIKAIKDEEKESEEQIEQRLGSARMTFFRRVDSKYKLTEEEEKIKELYEELDRQYIEKSVNIKNYEEYMEWCKKNGRLPRTGIQINGERIKVTKDGEKETEEQREIRLGSARKAFFTGIKKKDKLTEEEEKIKELYEELNKQYSSDILNYNEYKEWCKKNGRLPRIGIKINDERIKVAKDREKETKEQREVRLGQTRQIFVDKIKRKKERNDVLTEEEEKIKRLYEELYEQYGKKQPAKNIAPVVKNVPISVSREADEFIATITNEKVKEGVSHND